MESVINSLAGIPEFKPILNYVSLYMTVVLDRLNQSQCKFVYLRHRGRRGRDSMVVKFTTTYVISAYHHYEFEPPSLRGVLDTTLCDKVCLLLASGQWFSPLIRFPPLIKLTATILLKYC